MAEEMEVDMSFSDVMDVDISMADAEISKLLNGTQVLSRPSLPVPTEEHVELDDECFMSAKMSGAIDTDQIVTPNMKKNLNATYDYEDAHNTFNNDEAESEKRLDVAIEVRQAVQVKNELNSTFDVVDNQGDRNGNGGVNPGLNSTFDVNNEHPHANMADISSIGNISIIASNSNVPSVTSNGNFSNLSNVSKTSDFSSSEVTVLENQNNTLEANKAHDLSKTIEERSDKTVDLMPVECTYQEGGKVCKLLNITTDVEGDSGGEIAEKTSEKSEEDEVYEDALPPEEEIRQILDGRRVSLSRHTVEVTLDDQVEDCLVDDARVSEGACSDSHETVAQVDAVQENTEGEVEQVENVEDDVTVVNEEDQMSNMETAATGNIQQFFTSLTQKKRNSSLPAIKANEISSETLCQSLPVDFAGEHQEINEDLPIASSTSIAESEVGSENVTIVEDKDVAESTTTDRDVDVVDTVAESDVTAGMSGNIVSKAGASLLKSALNKCFEVASKTLNLTGIADADDCDTTNLLMLHNSVAAFESPAATSTTPEKQSPRSGLLDCTLDGTIVTGLSPSLQQEKVLQAANRKNEADKVPLAKESQASLLDKTLENEVENKENIKNIAAGEPAGRRSAVREKPRPSLLLQFDPLPNLNASVNEASPKVEAPTTIAVRPVAQEARKSPAKHVGRLIDVDLEHDLEHKRAMDAVNEEKMNLIQEVNRLKLELNQVKQENTTLTLEIQKKEEVYLKAEANNQMRESQLKTENKQLLEKLETMKDQNDNDELAQAKKQTKEATETNKRLVEENVHYKKIMNEYEATLSANNCEKEKLKAEHATVTQHLAALEVSFSDTITKYDRCKDIIAGFSRNEETLQERLGKSNQIATKYEERYETLKSHANAQLDKANKDLLAAKDSHRTELAKLNTIVKRLEIKNASLLQTLEQKTAECAALASLCDEMTGSAMH